MDTMALEHRETLEEDRRRRKPGERVGWMWNVEDIPEIV